ncbi:class I SAM-dependent methyltransferase [Streptomyces sp. enrichment culture]|uniref:class I SAM-dependent methyltransferase n=1 Tax=Streptomyces sp. enrichment culture TaxID=1795815 RepID=UPI003F577885
MVTERLARGLRRFNDTYPWDHNAHYHRWLLRQLPRRFGAALDVGCGTGDLARQLATRARRVVGLDADPEILALARSLTPEGLAVAYRAGDAAAGLPEGTYDVITCVATLHHLPLAEALAGFRRHLAPGGTLVVVGLYRARGLTDHLLGAVAVPLNAAAGWLRNRGRPAPRPAAMTARTRPAETDFGDIVREARRVLPGARLRRRLFWRYTLVWRR